jgi:phosphatidylcholine synthase
VLYLVAWQGNAVVNAVVLLALAVLVFVPVRYVYPSRTPVLQSLTLVLGAVWGISMLVVIATLPRVAPPALIVSLIFPVYYIVLSLVLDGRRRMAGIR